MKLSDSRKFWLIFLGIIFAACLGGVLGNWIYIYFFDKYYGVPTTPVIIRDAKKVIAEQDSRIAQAIAAADSELVRIFKHRTDKSEFYQNRDAVAVGAIVTSDGWLVTPSKLDSKNGKFDEFEAITSDRKRYTIAEVITDPLTRLSFVRLTGVENLPVKNFVRERDLTVGQTVIALDFNEAVEVGRLSRHETSIQSSEGELAQLDITGLSTSDSYLFDAAGQMIGLSRRGARLAMDSVQKSLEKLLTDGKITHPRLGIRYLDLSRAYTPGTQAGDVVDAVVSGSPADHVGLKTGDILLSIDDVLLNEFNDLAVLIGEYHPGDTIVISFRRGTDVKKVSVVLDVLAIK